MQISLSLVLQIIQNSLNSDKPDVLSYLRRCSTIVHNYARHLRGGRPRGKKSKKEQITAKNSRTSLLNFMKSYLGLRFKKYDPRYMWLFIHTMYRLTGDWQTPKRSFPRCVDKTLRCRLSLFVLAKSINLTERLEISSSSNSFVYRFASVVYLNI